MGRQTVGAWRLGLVLLATVASAISLTVVLVVLAAGPPPARTLIPALQPSPAAVRPVATPASIVAPAPAGVPHAAVPPGRIPPGRGGYSVQLGLFLDPAPAAEKASIAEEAGYAAFLAPRPSADGRTWFALLIGRYPDRSTALAMTAAIQASTGLVGLVTTAPDPGE
ncbi:MAG: SPOR domain-containing protein [Paracraurococcus sp.]